MTRLGKRCKSSLARVKDRVTRGHNSRHIPYVIFDFSIQETTQSVVSFFAFRAGH